MMLRAIIPLIGGVKGVVILLATALMGKLLLAIFQLTNALRILMLTLIANPILAVITALIVATVLLIEHWKDIKKTMYDVMEGIKTKIHASVLFIEHIIQTVFTSIKQFLDKLNPFEVIHRGIEKTKLLLGKLRVASMIPITTTSSLQQPWGQRSIGASHIMQRLRDDSLMPQRQEAAIKVRFENAPKGTRIQTTRSSGFNIDTSMGMQMIN